MMRHYINEAETNESGVHSYGTYVFVKYANTLLISLTLMFICCNSKSITKVITLKI
jgi:hypothetical protein